jgi:hypothetical protein
MKTTTTKKMPAVSCLPKLTVLLGFALTLGAAAPLLAAPAANNPILQYTMKAIGADVDVVTVPTKAGDPADVLDGDILAAITRSRTAAFQLQLIIDRSSGEMLPASLQGLSTADLQAKLAQMNSFLTQAKGKLADAESELQAQLPKLPENRDFRALAATLTDLGTIEAQAHQIFKTGA